MTTCGKYLGDNDGTCPQLTCVRERGHAGLCDNVSDAPDWVPVQAQSNKPAGSISWAEHLEAYAVYAARYGHDQSAKRLAERGGFGWYELVKLLGHEPTTWRAR